MTEEIEKKILSPFACLSSETRGRQYPESECLVRTAFQRDRDRIIHSKAFRRLKYKTQVFIAPEGDHYRTRLTHTLEVAQIARTVARALRLNEDLTEVIALAHDLGHTPFGHSGEHALNEVYHAGFKHNEQSLRVVEVLEEKNGRRGLNLTWEVRDGILNHTGAVAPATLEGQIVKIADRIAYINHDIDDALRAGILRQEDLPSDCLEVLGNRHSERINIMVTDLIRNSWNQPVIKMSKEVQEATDCLRQFLFDHVYIGSPAKKEEEKTFNLIKQIYHHFLEHPEDLPPGALTKETDLPRAVCDYIAGMTDRYAIAQYERFFVPKGFPLLG